MAKDLRVGDHVSWRWGTGEGHGRIVERFEKRVARMIKGEEIVRNGARDNPAFRIETDAGDEVLKLASELLAR